jgi:hypothetical protein
MKEIIANENMWLTQATLENEEERGFWKRLTPACSLTEDDFIQWTNEQKQEWEEKHAQINEE